jgi:hypothetical protein
MAQSIQKNQPSPKNHVGISEIFGIEATNKLKDKIQAFRLGSGFLGEDSEMGNQLSFHLSQELPQSVVIWYKGTFFALCKIEVHLPNYDEWKQAIESVKAKVSDLNDRYLSFQEVKNFTLNSEILSQFACRVIQGKRLIENPIVFEQDNILIQRSLEIFPETIDTLKGPLSALNISLRSRMFFKGNLEIFFENHPLRNEAEHLLVGLQVQDLDRQGRGFIRCLTGTMSEKREYLIGKATGSTSKRSLQLAKDTQPVVGVQFGKKSKIYEYALAALRPCLTQFTAERFNVEYGQLLKHTKISYSDRKNYLIGIHSLAVAELATYGITLNRSINERDYPDLFWKPNYCLSDTLLEFGKGIKLPCNKILTGLSNGGVYRRRDDLLEHPIQIGILKLIGSRVQPFVLELKDRLKTYGFDSSYLDPIGREITVNDADSRATIEHYLDELLALSPDVVLVFLPSYDRNSDDTKDGSLYHFCYSRILRRKIASQIIYEDTLRENSKNILNQVVPGVLAKLGNLPFILADQLLAADFFVGLDVGRKIKANLQGSMNACASIRVYGRKGDFINYRIEDALIEGEEIPRKILERILPANSLSGKVVLIYRDGKFCGQEVESLVDRAKAINAKFVLVESRKSGVPRLYYSLDGDLQSPDIGLALQLSSYEAILVTTKVSSNVGVPKPLRLCLRPEGHIIPLEQVLDATLKLTLLHHGALRPPRLPMPIYGADRVAGLRLQGVYPSSLEGDRQFWL